MSAQPEDLDRSMQPLDPEPLRLALWRKRQETRDPQVLVHVAERFATEANVRGGSFGLPETFRLINAITAVRYTLPELPRWVAESMAVALNLDPKVLWPEGCAPSPLRPVPMSGTPSNPVSPRPARGNHAAPSAAGKAGRPAPAPSPPPASPAKRVCTKCGENKPLDTKHFRTMGMTVKKPRKQRWAAACRLCEARINREHAARKRALAAGTEEAPAFKFPCRKPGCAGGSDRNEWGRDVHENQAHGQLYGPIAGPPIGMLHHRGGNRRSANSLGVYACPICPDTLFTRGSDLIGHLEGYHPVTERFDSFPVELIIAETGAHFGVSIASILSESRVRRTALARQVAMYVTRALTERSQPETGEIFERDHSTVLHAERHIAYLIRTDEDFAVRIQILLARIREVYDRSRRFRDAAPGINVPRHGGREGTDGKAVVCAPAEPPAPTGPPQDPEWEMPDDARTPDV